MQGRCIGTSSQSLPSLSSSSSSSLHANGQTPQSISKPTSSPGADPLDSSLTAAQQLRLGLRVTRKRIVHSGRHCATSDTAVWDNRRLQALELIRGVFFDKILVLCEACNKDQLSMWSPERAQHRAKRNGLTDRRSQSRYWQTNKKPALRVAKGSTEAKRRRVVPWYASAPRSSTPTASGSGAAQETVNCRRCPCHPQRRSG